jgi:NUAK family SNF1-like kinase
MFLFAVFENKEKIILVMEYAAGGELYDYINEKKVLHETEARKFFRQIVSAIHHCHQVQSSCNCFSVNKSLEARNI